MRDYNYFKSVCQLYLLANSAGGMYTILHDLKEKLKYELKHNDDLSPEVDLSINIEFIPIPLRSMITFTCDPYLRPLPARYAIQNIEFYLSI